MQKCFFYVLIMWQIVGGYKSLVRMIYIEVIRCKTRLCVGFAYWNKD